MRDKKSEALTEFYNDAIRLGEELQKFSDDLFNGGLDETIPALGVDDAMKALERAAADLDRRIQFAKEDTKASK